MRRMIIGLALSVVLIALDGPAQQSNVLVGAWQQFSRLNSDGTVGNPPSPPALMILSANGRFSQVATRAGRNKVNKEIAQLTKTELLNRFMQADAVYGTYTVSGNTLARKVMEGFYPNQTGREGIRQFRLEGDIMILPGPAGSRAETRYRRMKVVAEPTPNPLVGTWRQLSSGAANIPMTPVVLFISADGYYTQLAIPHGRSATKNDFEHMTRDELATEFGSIEASYGTYTISANKLSRQNLADFNPILEGKVSVDEFRIETDMLILTSATSKTESRFGLMK